MAGNPTPRRNAEMEKKKYTFDEVQKIARISPATLHELLQKNSDHIDVQVTKGSNGEEEFWLEQEALDRLLFIKQLRFSTPLSNEECVTQLTGPRTPGRKAPVPDLTEFMATALDKLAIEMKALKGILSSLLSRHQQVLRDLGRSQSENSHLNKEIEEMRQQQHSLLQELHKYVETDERPDIDEDDLKSVN